MFRQARRATSATFDPEEGNGDLTRRWAALLVIAYIGVIALASVARAQPPHHLSPARLRALVYRSHPCLAHIIDHEDGLWIATRYGAGGSYGLPQAQPGSKMASAGKDWTTNPWTQIRWMIGYVKARYGGECQAWEWWQRHYWY